MNGDVNGSSKDQTSTSDSPEKDNCTDKDLDTKLCHTKALSINHCDNSNSDIECQKNTVLLSENKPLENNTCGKKEQTEINDIDKTNNGDHKYENKSLSNQFNCDQTHKNDSQPDSSVKTIVTKQQNKASNIGIDENEKGDETKLTEDKTKNILLKDVSSLLKDSKTDEKVTEEKNVNNMSSDNDKKPEEKNTDISSKAQNVHEPKTEDIDDNEKGDKTELTEDKTKNILLKDIRSLLNDSKTNKEVTEEKPVNKISSDNDKEPHEKNTDIPTKAQNEHEPKTADIEFVDRSESDVDSELEDDDSLLAEDAVSINSESDIENIDSSSQDSQNKSDIVIIENDNKYKQNGKSSRNMSSPEIHEINSDMDDDDGDCILSEDNISDRTKFKDTRRLSLTCTEEAENGNESSDIEELETGKKISTKKTEANRPDSTSKNSEETSKKNSYTSVVCRDINSRGTTVSLINAKSVAQANTGQQQPILPSLTDDMFVVEAPSFIVPYVYEKPSMKPFREFVDKLGREIEEKEIKEEKERLQREKEEKTKKEKERQERIERGETVSEDEKDLKSETPKKEAPKKAKRRRLNEEDDASWDGSDDSDSEEEEEDEEGISDNDDKVEILKEKVDSMEGLKDVVASLTANKIITGVPDNYFDCTLGKFFIDIGLNLVQEYVQNDLLKSQKKKLSREKRSGRSTKAVESSINALMKNLNLSKENNASYNFEYNKCEFCSFKTESKIIMSYHLETPHMKNNLYKCNFCPYEVRSAHDILFHMEAKHNVKGRLERASAYHQCCNCQFEDSGKGKLARHQIACAKRYKPENNLSPPMDWEPPAKIPKLTKSRNSVNYNAMARAQLNIAARGSMNQLIPGASLLKNRPRATMPAPRIITPINRGPSTLRPHIAHVPPAKLGAIQTGKVNVTAGGSKSCQPSLSITPLPRAPVPIQFSAQQGKNAFVICEICDGYIKDLEQLRNHMQWIHKVKIHPKMIFNRPPLNCQKCQFRFFTDQGLERHLLGAHGLVTSSMQEASNKGKDAGRCPVCGKVYQWKLLNHVSRDHNLTLKPAHLSYKCTVCTATFGMYKLFENHVYSAHRVVAKKVTEKAVTPKESGLPKSLKISDEITIIPQPSGAAKRK